MLQCNEVLELRDWHKARMEELGYSPEVVCELSTAREKFFPRKYREVVVGTYVKPRFR